jgi:hypothetical protein
MVLCGVDTDRDRTLLSLKNDKIKKITIQSSEGWEDHPL